MPRDVYRDVGMPRVCVFTETHGQEMHTDNRDTCHGHAQRYMAMGMRTQTYKPAREGHMESLTETRFSGLSVVIGPCPYPPGFPRPTQGPSVGHMDPRTHHPPCWALPRHLRCSAFLFLALCPWSQPESLFFHFSNSDLFLLPKSPANSASLHCSLWPVSCRLYFLHLCLQVSLWLCRYITLRPLPCPASSPAILSLCLQPLHPSGVVPHF